MKLFVVKKKYDYRIFIEFAVLLIFNIKETIMLL